MLNTSLTGCSWHAINIHTYIRIKKVYNVFTKLRAKVRPSLKYVLFPIPHQQLLDYSTTRLFEDVVSVFHSFFLWSAGIVEEQIHLRLSYNLKMSKKKKKKAEQSLKDSCIIPRRI